MAIAIGTVDNSTNDSSLTVTSLTSSSIDMGSPDLIMFFLFVETTATAFAVGTSTWGGANIIELGTADNTQSEGPSLWVGYINNPGSGSKVFASGTFDSSDAAGLIMIGFTGTHATTPVGNVEEYHNTGVGATISNTVTTTAANSLAFLFGAWRGGDADPAAPDGSSVEPTNGELVTGTNPTDDVLGAMAYLTTTSTGDYTPSTTASVSDRQCWLTCEIFEDAGGGGSTQTGSLINKMESGYGALEGAGMNGRLQT